MIYINRLHHVIRKVGNAELICPNNALTNDTAFGMCHRTQPSLHGCQIR